MELDLLLQLIRIFGGKNMNFWAKIDTPLEFFVILCAILVVFVNGSTDAPNAIFSVVWARKLKLWQSVIVCGFFNFLGVFASCFLGGKVAKSITSLAIIGKGDSSAIICLSCFLTIIIFGLVAWHFGMPSSESHALIFSLAGASFASSKAISSLLKNVGLVLFYMVFSCVIAYYSTVLFCRFLSHLRFSYKNLLPLTCALASFMHGAQDGQKFIAILMILLGAEVNEDSLASILPIALLVGAVISLSSLFCGRKIVDSMAKVSNDNSYKNAFSSDLGSILTLIICSILGAPVSTGNIKSVSLFATSPKCNGENKKAISKILLTSLITIPICFILGAIFYVLFSRLI